MYIADRIFCLQFAMAVLYAIYKVGITGTVLKPEQLYTSCTPHVQRERYASVATDRFWQIDLL